MFYRINDKSYQHLICIILGGIENGEKIQGLAHVGEHMLCLLSTFDKCNLEDSIISSGYTCIDHACIHYAAKSKEKLYLIKDKIEDMSVIENKRIEKAKNQVINECKNLQSTFEQNNNVVRFITDGRVNRFAAGEINDISKIKDHDLKEWLACILKENRIFFFFLDDKKAIEKLNIDRSINKHILNNNGAIYILYIKEKISKRCDMKIYLKIDKATDPKDYLELLIGESFLQNQLSTYAKRLFVKEKYFTYSERYLLLNFKGIMFCRILSIISQLRKIGEETETYRKKYYIFKKFFYKKMIKQKSDDNNEAAFNQIINGFVYDLPIINVDDIKKLFKYTADGFPQMLTNSLKRDIKIII